MMLFTLLFASSNIVSAQQWTQHWFGSFAQCPANEYITGVCSSGMNADCNGQYTAEKCEPWPVAATQSTAYTPPMGKEINGWMCAWFGTLLECPAGQVMTGMCGSGHNADCTAYCGSPNYSAIKCEAAPSNIGAVRWTQPYGHGGYGTCAAGEVACGLCQSGMDNNCQGGSFRIGCCSTSTKAPTFKVTGYWQPLQQLSGPTTIALTEGATKTNQYTRTAEWSNAVTASASADFNVEGIGGLSLKLDSTTSRKLTNSYQNTWSTTTTTTITRNYDFGYQPTELWQWWTEIIDPEGNRVIAKSADLAHTPNKTMPPKCLPGYAAMNSTDFQTCTSGGYLPGAFPPQPIVRKNLRG